MIRRRRFLGAACLGWLGSGLVVGARPALGDDPSSGDDRVVRVLEASRGIDRKLPGMVGAIVKGDSISAIGSIGIRKIGSNAAMKPDDLVHLGSCTKAMTATMIGTLVDQGKLAWDATLADVFPEAAPAMHPGYRPVTLAQLLAHRSGLPRDVSWWELPGRSPTEARRGLLGTVLRNPPKSQPGSSYDYSNVGFVVAGLMAEEVSKTPWDELMKRRVFAPLGMASAGFGPPGGRGKVDQPWGHREKGGAIEPTRIDNPPSMGPAGTVHCSVPDWAKFASFHMKGTVGGKPCLLRPETLKALHTPAPGQEYVAGWGVREDSRAGGRVLDHRGSNTAWFCAIWVAPAVDLAVLVATNAGSEAAGSACDEAIRGLLDLEGFASRRGRRR